MNTLTSKKKKYLIMLLCLLFLSIVTAGIYLLVNPEKNNLSTNSIDKYNDVVNWCKTSLKDDELEINCDALLLDIHTSNGGNRCFDILIIDKKDKLQNLSVCEKDDNLAYTNDILEYKKLMPIDITFKYTKKNILNNYAFNNVSLQKITDTYVQDLVNQDITSLIAINPNSTTVQNSVDFCPKPSKLPNYITDENKKNYTEYFNSISHFNSNIRIMETSSTGEETFEAFLPCYPLNNCKYSNLLSTTLSNTTNVLSPEWGKTLTIYDYETLAQLSYFYTGQSTILPTYSPYMAEGDDVHIVNPSEVFAEIVKILSSNQNISEEIFCTTAQAINVLSTENKTLLPLKNSMQQYISKNISKSTFPLCYQDLKSDEYDKTGAYLMYRISIKNNVLTLLNKCLNLTNLLQ